MPPSTRVEEVLRKAMAGSRVAWVDHLLGQAVDAGRQHEPGSPFLVAKAWDRTTDRKEP